MYKNIAGLVLMAALCGCTKQPPPSDNGDGPLTAERIAAITAEVKGRLDDSTKAIVAADEKSVTDAFSKEFSSAGGDFQFESRDALIEGLRSGNFKFESASTEISDVKVATATTAVVSGRRSVKGTVNGAAFEANYLLKGVYALEDGKWKAVLWAVNGGC